MKRLLDHPIDALVAAARRTLEVEIGRLRRASAHAARTPAGLMHPEYQKNLIAACKVAGDLKKVDIAEQTAKKKRLAALLPNLSDSELEEVERRIRAGEDPLDAAGGSN